ncbi:TPA: hypothetical protein DIU27_03100 [Candidatus Collierbacteria bacterium]|nr:hypothetical protein [Candidatus Collierbacteria bacterium]
MGLSIVGGVLAFQIFSAVTKTQLTAEQVEIIRPIDGTINQTVIDNLEKRTPISEDELSKLEMETPIEPTPTTSIATESAQTTQLQ